MPLCGQRSRPEVRNAGSWLRLCFHSLTCHSSVCSITSCKATQQLLAHIVNCHGASCSVACCAPVRKLLQHYSKCMVSFQQAGTNCRLLALRPSCLFVLETSSDLPFRTLQEVDCAICQPVVQDVQNGKRRRSIERESSPSASSYAFSGAGFLP